MAYRVVELVEPVGGPRLVDDVLDVALGRHVAILGARAARERDREAHREEGRESEMKSHGMHPFSGKPDHRLPLCRFPPPASSTKLGPHRRDGGGRIFPMIGNIFSIHWKIAENFFQSLEKRAEFSNHWKKFSNHWKTSGGRKRQRAGRGRDGSEVGGDGDEDGDEEQDGDGSDDAAGRRDRYRAEGVAHG